MSLPARLLIALVTVLTLMAISAKVGYDLAEGYAATSELEATKLDELQAASLRSKVNELGVNLATEKAAQKPKDRIIYREVVRYELLPPDRRVTLDGAWRLLHDSAATGDPSVASSAFTDSASPVTDAEALTTVSANYEQCREWRQDIIAWQAWYALIRGDANGKLQQVQ